MEPGELEQYAPSGVRAGGMEGGGARDDRGRVHRVDREVGGGGERIRTVERLNRESTM